MVFSYKDLSNNLKSAFPKSIEVRLKSHTGALLMNLKVMMMNLSHHLDVTGVTWETGRPEGLWGCLSGMIWIRVRQEILPTMADTIL